MAAVSCANTRSRSVFTRTEPATVSGRTRNSEKRGVAYARQMVGETIYRSARRLTRGRTRRGPASARRPSRLLQRHLNGVTPPASRASNAGRRRAAAASARGPWPRGLTSRPLARPMKEAASPAATMDSGQGQSCRSPARCNGCKLSKLATDHASAIFQRCSLVDAVAWHHTATLREKGACSALSNRTWRACAAGGTIPPPACPRVSYRP